MTYKIDNAAFENYTGKIGKVNWVDGKTDKIEDPLDFDMTNNTFGVSEVVETSKQASTAEES